MVLMWVTTGAVCPSLITGSPDSANPPPNESAGNPPAQHLPLQMGNYIGSHPMQPPSQQVPDGHLPKVDLTPAKAQSHFQGSWK